MDTDVNDPDLVARLRRLEATAAPTTPAFGYDGLLARHGVRQARERRRQVMARGTASALILALIAASVWRFEQPAPGETSVETASAQVATSRPQSRIVRADTYLAVAALEDHIATFDDAVSEARVRGRSAEAARLERTRDELLDSYAQVRYAELVSANF